MVEQVSTKGIEDTTFLRKEVSEQLIAIEDFLPVQINVWSSYVLRQGSHVSDFHLLRIIDEEPEGLKTLTSDEVELVNFDPEHLSRMRVMYKLNVLASARVVCNIMGVQVRGRTHRELYF
jgi:hypothetical protein